MTSTPTTLAPAPASTPTAAVLQVRKTQLSDTRIVPASTLAASSQGPLEAGQVLLRVDRFALTSNNITYAAFGDAMNYWAFYPTGEADWGTIPVWGFATVVASQTDGVEVGQRYYGYYPMASHAVLTPRRISPHGFFDAAPYRVPLAAVYNDYRLCSADPFYSAGTEDLQALLRPLFITSWLIDDFLADNQFFGAQTLVLSSASSKTAYGTAFMLAQRKAALGEAVQAVAGDASGRGIEIIGLTSAANVAFCESLGCYDRVLRYDQLDAIAADTPMVYVDFAGNAKLRLAIHTRFTALQYSSAIGGTHVDDLGSANTLPGPRATLFFAPAQIKKRSAEWGGQELGTRLLAGWQAFIAQVTEPGAPWLTVTQHQGPEAVTAAYKHVLAGQGDPRVGHMLGWSKVALECLLFETARTSQHRN